MHAVLEEARLLAAVGVARRHEALGLAGLDLEGTHARAQFAEHIVQTRRVLEYPHQTQLRLVAPLAIATDAGGLLENRAALERVGREDGVDASLFEHRVAAAAEARVEEHVAHILEAHAVSIDQVLALAGLEHAPGDGHLAATAFEQARVVVDHKRHLGHGEGRAAGGALEDHVAHLRAAHGGRARFAEHPADGVDDVALAAAVGSDDACQGVLSELENRAVGEGLEAEELKAFEAHLGRWWLAGW